MNNIIVIAHNIRSTHNVGALFRTCDGFGIRELILSGYTPYPEQPEDTRLPHVRRKTTEQIHKTALGAEQSVPFRHVELVDIFALQREGYTVAALEQDSTSTKIQNYKTPQNIALLLGEEVEGIDRSLLESCDVILEIPMSGSKESFNVSVAAGIALYHLHLVGILDT